MRKYANANVSDGEDIRKRRRSALIKLAVLMTFSLIIWIFSSIAWFSMNKDVDGNGMGVTTADLPFEVAVSAPYTNSPDYSSLLQSQLSYNTSAHETSGNVGEIKCLMNDATADPTNPMRGMQPGSYGSITFMIKPKITGTYTIHFDIAAVGYHAEFETDNAGALQPNILKNTTVNGESVPVFYSLADYAELQSGIISELEAISSPTPEQREKLASAREDVANSPKASRFLKGHILFFENWSSSTKYYSDFIDPEIGFDRTYTFTADDVAGTMTAARTEELTVTLYWIWPNTFAQIVLDNGNTYLNERDAAMFGSTQPAISGQTPREKMIAYIASHSDLFFESTNAVFSDTIDPDSGEVTETAASKIAALIAGLSSNPDDIVPLNNGYNNSDQIIGENVQILFTEITASVP